jgi:hypothetical protein
VCLPKMRRIAERARLFGISQALQRPAHVDMQQMWLWVWNIGLAQHTTEPVHAGCLVKHPISPVRGASKVKANLFVGFDIDPAATRKTATWKSDGVRPFAVDNREFQVAVERCGIY